MKQKMLSQTNFISRKGSVTVIALLFVLFLAIVGAGWGALMASENTSALADEDISKATYAAEAGLKRAMMELRNNNATWTWLATADSSGVTTDNFMDVATGVKPTETNTSRYEVYITYVSSGSTIFVKNSPTLPTANTTYTVYSVGRYKDTKKALRKVVIIGQK